MTEHHDTDYEPHHESSPTDHVLQELALYGYRPFEDEPDPRPLPEGNVVAGSIADIFDALVVALSDTRLEPDLEELLWGTVNLFQRAGDRIARELDDNEVAQRRLRSWSKDLSELHDRARQSTITL
jgi:hypothetical protein